MPRNILISNAHWTQWVESSQALPVVVSTRVADSQALLPADFAPLWAKLGDRPTSIFESGKGGRYTYVVADVHDELRGDAADQPLTSLRAWMSAYVGPDLGELRLPKFIGGCMGYFNYDLVRAIEKLPATAVDDLPLPDYYFQRVSKLWVIDHETRDVYACVWRFGHLGAEVVDEAYEKALNQAREMLDTWTHFCAYDGSERAANFATWSADDGMQVDWESAGLSSPFEKADFEAAVIRIQDYIRAGDVFQVNLSLRLQKALQTSPERVYEWLRVVNPSPYMGVIRAADFAIVSASPELLIAREGTRLSTRPIAGTRRRGASEAEDRAMRDELLHSEKERAEHIMLVDLERNDLGRISRFGTVRVDELMSIEYYSHVMHIVSEVTGELADNKDTYDALAAVFPGGTITGAPKIRTMEIIEELEPVRRGPYTGSMGWIDYAGNMEFNIIIRTMVAHAGTAYVQAGAGIVIDSIPEREYKESLNKAKAIWKAIQYAEREQQEEQPWS